MASDIETSGLAEMTISTNGSITAIETSGNNELLIPSATSSAEVFFFAHA